MDKKLETIIKIDPTKACQQPRIPGKKQQTPKIRNKKDTVSLPKDLPEELKRPRAKKKNPKTRR